MQRLELPSTSQLQLLAAGAAIFWAGVTLQTLVSRSSAKAIILSPRETLLPKLTEGEKCALPYPPDALPGARDVNSPFGTFRAYEFGPENGRKVLLVHGISTPCLALGGVAHALAEKGCRVLLFDLPGRGYSDTPADLHHDMRLFVSQILIVLASSPLAWTGPDAFSLVGYSLGGGISAAFTSYFPDLVRSLVLIAPAGLIRDRHISPTSRIIYAKETIFEPILIRIVRARLCKPLYQPKKSQPDPNEHHSPKAAVQAEVNMEGNQKVVLSKKHPDITIEAAVKYQVEHHQGFAPAFMSSIRYGPIQRQHALWRKIGQDLAAKQKDVLAILGERDPIINAQEIQEDAGAVFGGRVKFVVMDAGHEAPVIKGPETAEHIWKFWQEGR